MARLRRDTEFRSADWACRHFISCVDLTLALGGVSTCAHLVSVFEAAFPVGSLASPMVGSLNRPGMNSTRLGEMSTSLRSKRRHGRGDCPDVPCRGRGREVARPPPAPVVGFVVQPGSNRRYRLEVQAVTFGSNGFWCLRTPKAMWTSLRVAAPRALIFDFPTASRRWYMARIACSQ